MHGVAAPRRSSASPCTHDGVLDKFSRHRRYNSPICKSLAMDSDTVDLAKAIGRCATTLGVEIDLDAERGPEALLRAAGCCNRRVCPLEGSKGGSDDSLRRGSISVGNGPIRLSLITPTHRKGVVGVKSPTSTRDSRGCAVVYPLIEGALCVCGSTLACYTQHMGGPSVKKVTNYN